MPSSTNPAYCTQIGPQKGGHNFDRRLLSTILDSGTRPYMPGKRATSRVERAIMLLTALKPDRMGAERAHLLNKEQRYPFVLSQIRDQRSDQISCVLHHQLIKRQKPFALSARAPSFERDRPVGDPPGGRSNIATHTERLPEHGSALLQLRETRALVKRQEKNN